MDFPRFVAIEIGSKYLRYVNEDGASHGFLQFSESQFLKTPYTKFELEYPKSGADGLFHIRCCYNNTYLAKSSEGEDWIVGKASQPEEDKSKWSCTLLQPVSTASGYFFRHVQTGHYVGPSLHQSHHYHLHILSSGYALIGLVDLDNLLTLPKYIAFRGDNGKYLRAHWVQKHEYNEFLADNIGDKVARYQVFPLYDGRVRIKSLHYNKFWRRSPNWIWSDSTDTSANNKDTLFFPVKVVGKVIALKNLGNNYFCKRLTTEGKTNCLNAATSEITNEARLEVVEAVLRREIYNVTFQMKDARIYNLTTVESVTKEVSNRGTQSTQGEVKFSYTETKSNNWSKTNSWSVGVSITMTSGVPVIQETGIRIDSTFSGNYSWGESQETSKGVSTTETVITPPMTKSMVTMLVQRGAIDIPFTYSQRDTLYDGTTELTRETDGIFSGVNTFVKYDISHKPLTREIVIL